MAAIPSTMRAIEIAEPGGPEVLRVVERPVPQPGAGEVLIRVSAAGVNRPDIMQRLGQYPPPPGASDIPGLEVAGIVAAGGPGTTMTPGSRVCALVAGGGYAEYCAAPQPQCLTVPSALRDVEAAAVPETFFTVWTNLFERGGLQRGETALIHGGTSGIGTTAIQLARAFGAIPVATAGSDAKCGACIALGAAHAINYTTTDFVAAVREVTAGAGVDVILDIVGGDYLPRNIESLRLNGRLVQIGLMGGARGSLNLTAVLHKRLTITGSTLRARTVEEKGAIAGAVERAVWPLLERGDVRPIVHATFPMSRAADAHGELESGRVIGKVVLDVRSAR
jgi:putative PIG3 family NAD(P)H quinone oxidoreductase